MIIGAYELPVKDEMYYISDVTNNIYGYYLSDLYELFGHVDGIRAVFYKGSVKRQSFV